MKYANPHAPTGIWLGYATSTLVYDANGNVTQYGTTTAYTYDYRNRMNAAGVLGATSTYGYDHTQQRMRQTLSNGTRTDYPSKFYSITSTTTGATTTATSTAYIWQGDTMVAHIEQLLINGVASGTPRMYFTHPDHLGSTNVVTNASGTVVQTVDYYPYGSARIDTGSADSARKFIGQFADDPTALSYLNARYYDPGRAGFLSQDPVHLAIGIPAQVEQIATINQHRLLLDPQQLNSYSYARGNPLVNKDPQGNLAFLAIPAVATAPQWLPAVTWGVAAAGAYIAADIALRGQDWGARWRGLVQTLDPAKMGFGRPPMGPEDWRPNLGGKPPWMKIATIVLLSHGESTRHSRVRRDSAHGRDSRQDGGGHGSGCQRGSRRTVCRVY